MADNSDLPIALRRTRRSVTRLSAQHVAADAPVQERDQMPSTPSRSLSRRRGTKKQVRFSNPGPVSLADGDAAESAAVASTGLTPMIRRTSLAVWTATPASSSRRRHSAPALGRSMSPARRGRGLPSMDAPSAPFSGEVTFLPLRQVLDGRVKRRLRRNGLSEEMNSIHAEKRQQAAAARAELERLRMDVAEKDAAIQRLQQQQRALGTAGRSSNAASDVVDDAADDDTIEQDSDRIMDLERQVAELRRELMVRTRALSPSTPEMGHRSYNWTLAARDPFNSTLQDDEDEVDDGRFQDIPSPALDDDDDDVVFSDITMAELQSSTPSRPARERGRSARPICATGSGSFPTPPPTSPAPAAALPTTPVTPTGRCFPAEAVLSSSPVAGMLTVSTRPQADAEMQASLPDAETERLQEEFASLQRETAKLEEAVAAHQSLMARLHTKLAEGGFADGAGRLEEHVTSLLRSLSDKTAALAELSAGLHRLGFQKGGDGDGQNSGADGRAVCADPSEVVTSLAAAFRSARLELEYLTPGEIALPLTATGAAVLDLLMARLRTLGRQVHEASGQMDECREVEHSLRQQLDSRVAAMDDLAGKVAVRDARIGELETAVQSKDADAATRAAAHEERVAELEDGLGRLKSAMACHARDAADLGAMVQRLEATLGEKEVALGEKQAAVDALEARLAAAISAGETLLADAAADHGRATAALHEAHGRELALRDGRVAELRGEIDQVNAALRTAQDAARQLRLDNADLCAQLDAHHGRAQVAVATLQAELTRMVGRLGKELLAGAAAGTPPVVVCRGPFAGPAKRPSCSSTELDSSGEEAGSSGRSSATAEKNTSRKRRRYDSGLSFLEEEIDG